LGGGIYNASNLTLNLTTISDNTTYTGEEGWCDMDVCYDNRGGYGGGIYNAGSATLTSCIISHNQTGDGGKGGWGRCGAGGSGGYGGGIYNSGELILMNLVVRDNTTGNGGLGGVGDYCEGTKGLGGPGGGIYLDAGSVITPTNLSLLGNATGSGSTGGFRGGIFMNSITDSLWKNAIIAGNSTDFGGSGSGLYIAGSHPRLEHLTLAQNTGGDGSGIYLMDSTLSLTNTILVSQTVGITVSQNSTATLEATLWGSGAWENQDDLGGNGRIITGTINYWGDPAFVNPRALDYHIKANSYAIDRGISAGVTTDIDNQPRPNPDTGIPDLGADEYWVSIPIYLPFIQNH
jgi:autotransporter family porin